MITVFGNVEGTCVSPVRYAPRHRKLVSESLDQLTIFLRLTQLAGKLSQWPKDVSVVAAIVTAFVPMVAKV